MNPARHQPAQSFELFPRLPIELQRRIWELCLPARVVELDLPATDGALGLLAANKAPFLCTLQRTSNINSRIPLATRICRESRSVALLSGLTELYDDDFYRSDTPEWVAMNDIMELWVTPRTDVLHLNYDESYNDGWFTTSGNPLPLLIWLVRRNRHFTRMSIVASLVLGFDDYDGAEYRGGSNDNLDVLANGGGPYLTTLCVVSLHSGLDVALRKEGGMLFGRLGEERVKLVEAGDRAALQAYYNLWAAGPVDDRNPAQFFDLAVSRHESEWLPRVAQWKERLVTRWVNHYWLKAKAKNQFADIQDHQGVWRMLMKDENRIVVEGDPGPFSDYMQPKRYPGHFTRKVPNKEHPWVAGVLRNMPSFEPMVMFRLCEDKCHVPRPAKLPPSRGGWGTKVQSRG